MSDNKYQDLVNYAKLMVAVGTTVAQLGSAEPTEATKTKEAAYVNEQVYIKKDDNNSTT